MRRSTIMLSCIFFFIAFALISVSYAEDNSCVSCHEKLTPGQVNDWKISKHSAINVTCSTCHGNKHKTAQDAHLAEMPDDVSAVNVMQNNLLNSEKANIIMDGFP